MINLEKNQWFILKKKSPRTAIVFTTLVLIFSICIPTSLTYQNPKTTLHQNERAIVWDATINFVETSGKTDNVIFGEAPDANDGPPVDAYDTEKPPSPPTPPYIRAWFNDSLPVPYHQMSADYRHFPDTNKTWNLTVLWFPSDYISPTTMTLSWNPLDIDDSEYLSVNLCTLTGTILKNMLVDTSYTFTCPAISPQYFRIKCSGTVPNNPPYAPNTPNPANHATGISVNTVVSWLGGDPDPGDTVTYDVYFGTPSNPLKVVSNQSLLTYDPPGSLNYNTKYYWRIVAWDNHGASNSSIIWDFTTEQVPNNPPYTPNTPNPANHATGLNINTILTWLGGDPDAGDTVTYDVYFGTPSNPPKVVSNQTSTSYSPTMNFGTKYYWKIVAWDNHGATAVGSIWDFTTNYQPIANDDTAVVQEDSTNNQIDVLANDNDPDNNPLTILSVTNPPHGTATTDGDYVYYTPDPNYFGQDSFSYTISDGNGGTDTAQVNVIVNPVNDPPTAIDDTATVQINSVDNQIDVLANDYDVDGDSLNVTGVTNPQHGTAYYTYMYVFYTPASGYSGSDTFTYSINDGHGGVDSATINITVLGNLPPNKPSRPDGPTRGKYGTEYTYTTTSTDPEGDQVYYNWSWGDSTYTIVGPFDSGEPASASHTWESEGSGPLDGSYNVKVMAIDTHDAESPWSDPLPITMPRLRSRSTSEQMNVVELNSEDGTTCNFYTQHHGSLLLKRSMLWSFLYHIMLLLREWNFKTTFLEVLLQIT